MDSAAIRDALRTIVATETVPVPCGYFADELTGYGTPGADNALTNSSTRWKRWLVCISIALSMAASTDGLIAGLRPRGGLKVSCPVVRKTLSGGISPVTKAYNVAPKA